MRNVKRNRFLHKNQHAQRKFVNRKNGKPPKVGTIFDEYSFLKITEIEKFVKKG